MSRKIIADIERAVKDVVDSGNQRQNLQEAGPSNPQPVAPIDEPSPEAVLNARLHQERRTLNFLNGDQKYPVHRIEPIKTYNYYGYHDEPEDFFRLHLYNPRMVKQLALIFEDCKVLGRFVPVFWAHLPYILLFFIDNNLRGMQFIDLEQLYWRRGKAPQPASPVSFDTTNPTAGASREDLLFDIEQFTTDLEPISTCELEADVRYEWILNRQRMGSKGNDDALRELWLDDQEVTQTSQTIEPKLPLFDLERSYIQQLCDSFDVDCKIQQPIQSKKSNIKLEESSYCDSDSSLELLPACDDDEFTDGDDEEFFRSVPKIIDAVEHNQRINQEQIPRIKSENSQKSTTSSRETVSHEFQCFCTMSMEVHASTRAKLRPDPKFDPIEAVFYCVRNDTPETCTKAVQIIGMIITDASKGMSGGGLAQPTNSPSSSSAKSVLSSRSNLSFAGKIRTLLQKTGLSMRDMELHVVDTELELVITLIEVVKAHDPEILLGYEMEKLSWGYVLERSSILNVRVDAALSRITEGYLGNNSKAVESNFVQPIMFTGRMVFSVWNIIKHEINLNTCSYERIHHHALNERVPCFAFDTLTKWFNENRNRWRVIDYYLLRVVGQMRILDKFDLIAKISELARVYGTQFIDVMTRGSQIGIESMMLRLAKLQNLSPLSPTVMQRNKMKAPEALPLVMEPETNIYYDPVAVLDFQSLYPSVVIAYNYCYSTCLGRVTDLERKDRHNFGCSQLHVREQEVRRLLLGDSVHVSPCGVAYVKKNIRQGILPKMLSELITTRAMVKDQMKKNMRSARPNRRLQRILDHRQHGLKMMANTTYGYAGASYTGRMPCVEIADSIVSKGRETLEKAIAIVESRAEWGAKVVYGDTDSIFIQFKNCDRDTAFGRAFEMVDAITAANPHPIKMKFEKIYQPCVLQTKKRYCGFKYEQPEQTRPEFEVKGMEMIRRDCCPAAAHMLEMALRIQFTTRDIEKVKKFVQHQFVKIMSGKLSHMQEFIFARKYKPRDLEKNESVFVPAWQITKRLLATDPRAEPRLNERVPFVIIYGEPRTPLVNLAKTPIEVLENLSYRINSDYYIQKIICPTLNRVFCTMQVDTLLWYKSMPRQNIIHRSHYLVAQKSLALGGTARQSTMSQYFSPSHCPVCAKSIPVSDDICDDCREDLQSSVVRLTEEITHSQRKLFAQHQLCKACSSLERFSGAGGGGNIASSDDDDDEHRNPCISYDCENLFRYHQARLDALNSNYLSHILKTLN